MDINEEKLKGILSEHKKDTDTKIDGIKGHFNTVLKEHKKDTDTKIEEYKEEIKRYFDVAREDFDGKVKLIAEQYASIIEKLDSHEVRLVSMEKNIEIMKVDIVFIKSGMKKKVDAEEFETLERRVVILEAKNAIC